MKTILLSFVLFFSLNSLAFAQKQNLRLVDDIGQVLADDDYLKPARVIHIIFAKLEKKHRLKKPNPAIEEAITQMIALRRSYRASGETKVLIYRAYDHAIAGLLTADEPRRAEGARCDHARMKLKEAMDIYNDALKAYQKCLNGSSFSLGTEMPMMDSYLGGTQSNSGESASSNCQQLLALIEDAGKEIGRWGATVSLVCPNK
jgi:hypothetical protein